MGLATTLNQKFSLGTICKIFERLTFYRKLLQFQQDHFTTLECYATKRTIHLSKLDISLLFQWVDVLSVIATALSENGVEHRALYTPGKFQVKHVICTLVYKSCNKTLHIISRS